MPADTKPPRDGRTSAKHDHTGAGQVGVGQVGVDHGDDGEQVAMAVEVLRMIADTTRLRLLRALAPGELSVSDLSTTVGVRPASVSQHLAKLRMARLVTTRRHGTQVLYRVANEHVTQLVADALRHSEHLGPGTPAHHQQ